MNEVLILPTYFYSFSASLPQYNKKRIILRYHAWDTELDCILTSAKETADPPENAKPPRIDPKGDESSLEELLVCYSPHIIVILPRRRANMEWVIIVFAGFRIAWLCINILRMAKVVEPQIDTTNEPAAWEVQSIFEQLAGGDEPGAEETKTFRDNDKLLRDELLQRAYAHAF